MKLFISFSLEESIKGCLVKKYERKYKTGTYLNNIEQKKCFFKSYIML